MSTEIAVRAPTGLDIQSIKDVDHLAGRLAGSGIIPSTLRGKPADVMVILMTGHELGLSPMQSLRGLHVVEGKPVLSAELIVGLVKRSPACRWLRMVESTDAIATYETLREGEPEPTRLSWTIDQAKTAKLTGKNNWAGHPAAMLRARCAAALCRAVYPDVMMGILETDEADELRAVQHAHPVEGNSVPPPPPTKADEAPVDAEWSEPAAMPPLADEPAADPVAEWTERIQGAQTVPDLQAVGKALAAAHPDTASEVRQAVRQVYAARSTELRRGAA